MPRFHPFGRKPGRWHWRVFVCCGRLCPDVSERDLVYGSRSTVPRDFILFSRGCGRRDSDGNCPVTTRAWALTLGHKFRPPSMLCGLWTQSFINNLGTIGTAAYRFLWIAGYE